MKFDKIWKGKLLYPIMLLLLDIFKEIEIITRAFVSFNAFRIGMDCLYYFILPLISTFGK